MSGTIIWLLLIVLDKIFGLLHLQQNDVHSSCHLCRADVLLHPHHEPPYFVSQHRFIFTLLLVVLVVEGQDDIAAAVNVGPVVLIALGLGVGGEGLNTLHLICHF